MSRDDLSADVTTPTSDVSGESSTGGPMANPDSRESTNDEPGSLVAPTGAATNLERAGLIACEMCGEDDWLYVSTIEECTGTQRKITTVLRCRPCADRTEEEDVRWAERAL